MEALQRPRYSRRRLIQAGALALVAGGFFYFEEYLPGVAVTRSQEIKTTVVASLDKETAGDLASWPSHVADAAINNTYLLKIGFVGGVQTQGTAYEIYLPGNKAVSWATAQHCTTADGSRSPSDIAFLQLLRKHDYTSITVDGFSAMQRSGLKIISPDTSVDISALKFPQKPVELQQGTAAGVPVAPDYQPTRGEAFYVAGFPEEDAAPHMPPLYGTTVYYESPCWGGMWFVNGVIDLGSSGSPVLNNRGEAVGVIQGYLNSLANIAIVTPYSGQFLSKLAQ